MGFAEPAFAADPAAAPQDAAVAIHADRPGARLDPHIFGQFAEHLGHGVYDGIWVGPKSSVPNIHGFRRDVIDALKAIRVPVVRWPGGCFADEYNWREGIGPVAKRPKRVNTNWGGVTESNAVGTHEFMEFSELVGADAYVAGDLGSAPPREMAAWVEYMTSPTDSALAQERIANGRKAPWKLAMFGVGNELWGCGGNMDAVTAAQETRRYAAFIKTPEGVPLMKVASGASGEDYAWTETMMAKAGDVIDGLALHYYTVPGGWENKKPATGFDEHDWAEVLAKTVAVDTLLTRHGKIMDKYDPKRRVALLLDEWGTWYKNEPGTNPGFLYQQNSLRDALVAALNFNIFTRHAERLRGANIAQMVNVLQALILTDGAKMVRTPTYWAFDLYKDYQGATVLPVEVDSRWYGRGEYGLAAISASAVRDPQGVVHVALVNADPAQGSQVTVKIDGVAPGTVSGRILTADKMDAHNTMDAPDAVRPQSFTAARWQNGVLTATLPPKAVVMLELR
ncbi:alpha-N-arabinofuranosidase [Novosphingobium terrae]|uniref:alpha-N-arabinofuranosidase n=1 Tax=Novosphingobium terrae TaxID=2726189 RepID=UPI00198089C2|nr:alpha-L-arabinofuranosidase C-terminal domain-containing protein [Novosphingobium terrae]